MIRYLIVEDERFAYEELKRMMRRLRPDYELAGHTETVEQTVAFLRSNVADLLLLDIRLADGNSFEIFEQSKVNIPVVFTTAYDEHAIRAFKVNSIDYLLKPIDEADLQHALEKFEQWHLKPVPAFDYRKLEEMLMENRKKNRFLIQVGDTYKHIDTAEIAFFHADEKVVFLHTFSDKAYIVDYSLDRLENQLDDKQFFRVSRNCIANIRSISKISKYFNSRLKLTFQPVCPQEVLVSRVRANDFLKWVDGEN